MISSEVWNCCLSIIKLSIGIDTSAAIFGIMRFNETKELRFKIVGVTQISEIRNFYQSVMVSDFFLFSAIWDEL